MTVKLGFLPHTAVLALIPALVLADGSMLSAAGLQNAAQTSTGLQIVVVAGAGGVNMLDEKTAGTARR